jgi:SWI/SNF-related matrix-associated actin-dependent regulator 1 of chromatin subfamily A
MKMPKITKEIEEQLKKNNPVVLFVIHKEVLAAYKNHFGTDAYYLSGETSSKNREIARKGFEAGKKKLIILSIGAGKEGLTLVKSSYMVIGEIDWEAVPMLQAMDRIHRIGQTKECIIKIPYIPNTIDEYILGLVKEKLKVSTILL